jgi:hypothetical protein
VDLRVLSWSRYHINTIVKEEEGVFGDLLVFMVSPEVRRRTKLGSCCVSFSIAVSSLGCVVVILMRYSLIVRRMGSPQEQKVAC